MLLIEIFVSALIIGSIHGFKLGKDYVYKYETDVGTADSNKGSDNYKPQTAYRILADVHLTPVWTSSSDEELIQLSLDQLQLKIISKEKQRDAKNGFHSTNLWPIYIYIKQGQVEKIFCNNNDNEVLKNMKKSVFALLDKRRVLEEEDSCKITHFVELDMKKVKRTCNKVSQPKKQLYYIRTVLVRSRTSEEYHLDLDGDINAVNAEQRLELFSPLWSSTNVSVHTINRLKLEMVGVGKLKLEGATAQEAIASLNEKGSGIFVEESEISFQKSQSVKAHCDLQDIVNKNKKYLKKEDVGKSSSPMAFSTLLKCFRGATKEEIKTVLGNKKLTQILPQLLDVVAFTGTDDAIDAAFETLRFVEGDIELINRFLLPFAMNIHPTRKMIRSIQKTLAQLAAYKKQLEETNSRGKEAKLEANQPIEASLVAALGGLAKTLAVVGSEEHRQLIENVDAFLKKAINSCEDKNCILMYLKAVRTMALPQSKNFLLRITDKGGRISYEALSALKEMGFQNDPQCEKFCRRIFHQLDKKQETQNRVLAAEMLMNCYSDISTLVQLLNELQNQKHFEMATYLSSRIAHKLQQNLKFRNDILKALKEAKQYYSLAQKGDSVYFENQAIPALAQMSKMSGVNGTYSVGIELTNYGVLNRHHTDIFVHTPSGSEVLISASSYTQGLSSFFPSDSDEPDEGEADVDATAALELVISGIALPPVVFFKGVSDLMSRALSSDTSVPELRGNYLVAEYSDETTLMNGLPVAFKMESVVSNAIFGSFEFSLWSQTSKTSVTDQVALRLQGSASILTDFMELDSQLSMQSEFDVNFVSNAEFSGQPSLSCTEASHKDVHIIHERKSILGARESGFSHIRTKKKRWSLPGRSYAIHKKNNEMCAVMMYR